MCFIEMKRTKYLNLPMRFNPGLKKYEPCFPLLHKKSKYNPNFNKLFFKLILILIFLLIFLAVLLLWFS